MVIKKENIADIVSGNVMLPKSKVVDVIDDVCRYIESALVYGETVKLPIGTLEFVKRNKRKGRNLQTNEEIEIPERMAPKFTPSKSLKDAALSVEVCE